MSSQSLSDSRQLFGHLLYPFVALVRFSISHLEASCDIPWFCLKPSPSSLLSEGTPLLEAVERAFGVPRMPSGCGWVLLYCLHSCSFHTPVRLDGAQGQSSGNGGKKRTENTSQTKKKKSLNGVNALGVECQADDYSLIGGLVKRNAYWKQCRRD